MREAQLREGIDKTARDVQAHAARNGHSMTFEQAQARVAQAIRTTDRQQGGRS